MHQGFFLSDHLSKFLSKMSVFIPQVKIVLFEDFYESRIVLTSGKVQSKHHLKGFFWSVYFN